MNSVAAPGRNRTSLFVQVRMGRHCYSYEEKRPKDPGLLLTKLWAGCCSQWEGRRMSRCREGRQDPEVGLVVGQL